MKLCPLVILLCLILKKNIRINILITIQYLKHFYLIPLNLRVRVAIVSQSPFQLGECLTFFSLVRHVSQLARHVSHLFQLGETCVSPFSIPGSNTAATYVIIGRGREDLSVQVSVFQSCPLNLVSTTGYLLTACLLTACVRSVRYSPWHRHQIQWTNSFYCSSESRPEYIQHCQSFEVAQARFDPGIFRSLVITL